ACTEDASAPRAVVWCFLRDEDVVRMALSMPGRRHTHELGRLLQLLERRRAAIAHGRPQSANHLVDDFAQISAVGHAALDAFRNELLDVVFGILEVAVLRSRFHRSDGSHPAVALVLPA